MTIHPFIPAQAGIQSDISDSETRILGPRVRGDERSV
jgi:hypothetical protein